MALRKGIRVVNSGDLNSRIEILENVKKENELGETYHEWEALKNIWAHIVPQTGKLQNQQAETILTDVTHKVIVRYPGAKDITKDMQIKHNGHRYEIEYILNPYERNETLEIFCSEKLE